MGNNSLTSLGLGASSLMPRTNKLNPSVLKDFIKPEERLNFAKDWARIKKLKRGWLINDRY